MRIRDKLILFTTGVILVTTSAVATLAYRLQKELIERNRSGARTALVSNFASLCGQSLAINNELLLINYVKLLQASPGVDYAYFVDAADQIKIHSDRRFLYRPLSEWTKQAPSQSQEELAPVSLGGRLAGSAVIGFSKTYLQAALETARRTTLRRVAMTAGAVAAAALTAALLFSILLTRPLKALADGSERVGRGDFKTSIAVESADEVGELAKRFNWMAQNLAILDELKDQFIAIVSHDLRNPLAAIIAYADYMISLETGPLTDKQHEALQTITDQCRHLTRMVNNILDTSKLQSGRMEFGREAFDLAKTGETVKLLFTRMAKQRKLELLTDFPKDLPAGLGDQEKTQQVLANLMSNALKFTRAGSITIGARAASDGTGLRVFVKDTGCGIPTEEMPRLFGRFHQVDPAGQRAMKVTGTGLGLSISKSFVESMGGRIWVESKLNAGTTFFFTLPEAEAKA